MREIKFRAWAKKYGSGEWEMIHEIGVFPISCHCPFSISSDGIFVNPNYQDAVIEQCTGRLDKNGREIYEGDIVRVKVEDTEMGEFEIYWDDELCEFGYRFCNEPFNAQFYMDREIVGNIHTEAK